MMSLWSVTLPVADWQHPVWLYRNKGYTFNSSGLHPKTSAREQGLPLEEVSKLIVSQAVDGDVLTMAQSLPVKGILTGAAGYLGGPVAGLATTAAIAGLDLISVW